MHKDFLISVEEEYGLQIKSYTSAPRQFVAETFVLRISTGKQYFCKIIDKPLFIPRVIRSLPILEEMYKTGLDKINYPIRTSSANLFLMAGDTLIVLFNYIDARQSYNYDNETLGSLVAEVHSLTPKIKLPIPKEDFSFKRQTIFTNKFEKTLGTKSEDPVVLSLHDLLSKYEAEIRHDLVKFLNLCQLCKKNDYDMVITHGDAPGNTLVKSPSDIYLVDWDDILLAPPERDIWFLDNNPNFMKGYQQIHPHFKVNESMCHFFIYKRYFEDMVEYFEEILGDHSDVHRQKNLQDLKKDCFESWLRPSIREFDPL